MLVHQEVNRYLHHPVLVKVYHLLLACHLRRVFLRAFLHLYHHLLVHQLVLVHQHLRVQALHRVHLKVLLRLSLLLPQLVLPLPHHLALQCQPVDLKVKARLPPLVLRLVCHHLPVSHPVHHHLQAQVHQQARQHQLLHPYLLALHNLHQLPSALVYLLLQAFLHHLQHQDL